MSFPFVGTRIQSYLKPPKASVSLEIYSAALAKGPEIVRYRQSAREKCTLCVSQKFKENLLTEKSTNLRDWRRRTHNSNYYCFAKLPFLLKPVSEMNNHKEFPFFELNLT